MYSINQAFEENNQNRAIPKRRVDHVLLDSQKYLHADNKL